MSRASEDHIEYMQQVDRQEDEQRMQNVMNNLNAGIVGGIMKAKNKGAKNVSESTTKSV